MCAPTPNHAAVAASRVLCLLALVATLTTAAPAALRVEATSKPGRPWREYETRLISDLPANVATNVDRDLSRFGGLKARQARATGFFYPTNTGGRWWLVDPDGYLFLHIGAVSVRPEPTPGAAAALKQKFGSETQWASNTTRFLRAAGYNGLGAWSHTEALRPVDPPLVYTKIWNFMSSYGRKRGGTYQKPGHTGYPNDCIFVFDPEFERFCDEHAKQLAATKDDSWLLGHFSDNEMPLSRAALTNYLRFPTNDPGYQAAMTFLRQRHGAKATAQDASAQDHESFLALVVDRYCRVVSQAIKRYDPNHLFLGSRFHGGDVNRPEIFRAAGRYLDIVAVNYYNAWSPDPAKLAMWTRESGRPVMITEWYAKGADSGMPNTGGAGWLVKTQRDRGHFYQNFTLGLLESPNCVGWHWFRYADNDMANTKADPSNRDSNKGIVTAHFEPYHDLVTAMREVNVRAYTIAEWFVGVSVER